MPCRGRDRSGGCCESRHVAMRARLGLTDTSLGAGNHAAGTPCETSGLQPSMLSAIPATAFQIHPETGALERTEMAQSSGKYRKQALPQTAHGRLSVGSWNCSAGLRRTGCQLPGLSRSTNGPATFQLPKAFGCLKQGFTVRK